MKVNPFGNFFRALKNIPNLENYKIHIRSNVGLDQRIYNTPLTEKVVAIWIENIDFEENFSQEKINREILVYNYSGYRHKVEYYCGCYDPLLFPLLFPHGDTSWHQGIQRINK